MIPVAGSAYTYGYATLGELVAWIIGWDLILEYLFARLDGRGGLVGLLHRLPGASWASTCRRRWPARRSAWSARTRWCARRSAWTRPPAASRSMRWPHARSRSPIASPRVSRSRNGLLNLPAVVLVLLLTALLVVGIKESARFNNVIVFVKVAIVLLVIGFGFKYVNTANWTPFIPPNTGEFGQFGWSGVIRGAAVIFFAYIGFDAVSHRGAGSEEPAEGPADRHARLAGDLHGAVHPDGARHDGPGALHRAQRAAPGVRGDREGGPGARVARLLRQHRRHRRPRLGGAGDAHGPAAHLLHDVARRPAPAGVRQGAPEVRHAVRRRPSSPASWRR